jgi:SAM-dependent methyltransferase
MNGMDGKAPQDPVDHFTARAMHYDKSSRWCTDNALGDAIVRLTQPTPATSVLDVACGTGLVSRLFHGQVKRVVGLDITPAMAERAKPHLDEFVAGSAEALPFQDDTFDIVVSRQGIQFMDDAKAVKEMVRVAKKGGRICLVQLCAYGPEDREEFFRILRLRNPARKRFYLREDLHRLLADAGCQTISHQDHISEEDVDAWSDNRAIGEDLREGIRRVYRDASPAFRRLHGLRNEGGHFVDRMLFCLALGVK